MPSQIVDARHLTGVMRSTSTHRWIVRIPKKPLGAATGPSSLEHTGEEAQMLELGVMVDNCESNLA